MTPCSPFCWGWPKGMKGRKKRAGSGQQEGRGWQRWLPIRWELIRPRKRNSWDPLFRLMIIDGFFLLLGPKRFATYFPYKDFASKTTMSNGRNINRQRLKVRQERLKLSGIVGYQQSTKWFWKNDFYSRFWPHSIGQRWNQQWMSVSINM